jgi:rubredoxin
MIDYKLHDGTWVTTAVFVGDVRDFKSQCDVCDWVDEGPPSAGNVPVQPQRCRRCGWVRARYIGDPHPEVPDG